MITGAASGLGRALATELALRQCHVALVDIDAAALGSVAAKLARPGIVVSEHCADVASEQAVKRVAAEVERIHKAVHLLINNAALSASASFANTGPADFERILRVNFLGSVYFCRALAGPLQGYGEGQILNVASCFAWHGCPRKTAYASSKGALRSFSESLRMELASAGVGVTVLYPGPLATSIVRDGISDSEQRREQEQMFLRARGLPLKRVARRCLDQLPGNPSRIVIGMDYHMMDWLTRLSPALAGWTIRWGAARSGL